MTVLTAVQKAAVEGLALVRANFEVLYSGTRQEHLELQAIANSSALAIARAFDWPLLKKEATITGDGTTEDFDLPDDYDRMTTDARLWSTRFSAPLQHIVSEDKWLGLKTLGEFATYGAWIMYGGHIHIKPAPATGEIIKYFYMTNNIVVRADNSLDDTFTTDDDAFRLDEELLKYDIIWRFKQQKGRPYAEEMATFEREMARRVTREGGAQIIRIGTPTIPANVDIAYPYTLG